MKATAVHAEQQNKQAALELMNFWRQGRFEEGLRFFSPDCKTHNPYFAGDIKALVAAQIAANKEGKAQYPQAEFAVKHALADGDLVAIHTELLSNRSKPGKGGLRQVHLFHFDDGLIVEYWDITQQITPDTPNAAGAF